MCVTPLGFYLRVIVNEKILNLEKTTSSVLSVLLLIYALIYSSCLLQFSGLRGFESLALAQINLYMFATWWCKVWIKCRLFDLTELIV